MANAWDNYAQFYVTDGILPGKYAHFYVTDGTLMHRHGKTEPLRATQPGKREGGTEAPAQHGS